MYLDFLVKIPDAEGKITYRKKGASTYVNYEYGREYDRDRQFNIPKRVTIGKRSGSDPAMMLPNMNFLTYFPEAELPEEKFDSSRSSSLKIGAYVVIRRIMDEYGLPELLSEFYDERELGLFLDLACYSIICENNAAQYYPDYAYNHPLFTKGMRIYSDSKVSDFLCDRSTDCSVEFMNRWNGERSHREKIYISYDATNKNCQAGEIEIVEQGKPKVDTGKAVFNYSIGYDSQNREPLFYEKYPGSIVDIAQFQYTLEKVKAYGYRNIGFILDRGYFSRENIEYMDRCGYDFVIMVKGMSSLVNELILKNKGTFEDKRAYSIRRHRVYGKTVRHKLYATDEKERYFHIYHSTGKEHGEREEVEEKIERYANFLEHQKGYIYDPGDQIRAYFEPFIDSDGVFTFAREKADVIERELYLCGYFVIVTSKKMTAAEAIELYRSRDASEKLFSGDKTFLGDRSVRNHTNESVSAKIFVEFVALIVRNRIYTRLKDEMETLEKRPNYMTVPAALRELEKIEVTRGLDRIYRMDHAVTKTQKAILKAFGLDAGYMKEQARRISEQLRLGEEIGGR